MHLMTDHLGQRMSLVKEFYKDAQREWDRLDIPLCRIEFASTLALIDTYLGAGQKKESSRHRGSARPLYD
jgi:hypothetical protein